MKTAIRSSTFWSILSLLILVSAPTRAIAAGAATPTPTPAGPSYFITWNGTASDTSPGRNQAEPQPGSCRLPKMTGKNAHPLQHRGRQWSA
jgi:hypothetical protein